ncbi:MAG TPA: archease [Thermodesulfobacteriota bacterium]|nr:archease [Thermodesulfobacteriota bacterium]
MPTTTKRAGGRRKTKAAEVVESLPLSVEAGSVKDLFIAAARAVYDAMVEAPPDLAAGVAVQINLDGNGWADLLVHWVRELVAAHQQRGYVFKKFVIHELTKHRLAGEAWGERLPPERAPRRRQVRGIPYHRAVVDHDEAAGRWTASFELEVAPRA